MKRAAAWYSDSLAVFGVVLALVRAVEELSVEQLDCDDGENKLEEKRQRSRLNADASYARGVTHLEQYVDDEDVEHILQGIDDAVEHSLEFGHPLDRLQRPEDAEHAQRLDRAQVLAR